MHREQKVLWTEGMFLLPQHFQQWDNHQEQLLQFRLNSLASFGWGLTELEINRDSIANGHFSVVKCSGVFPGGTVFDVPDTDEPPPARVFKPNLGPSARTLDVFVALPEKHSALPNLSVNPGADSQTARYRKETIHALDQNTGENEREIAVARKNLKLLFSGEPLDGYDQIQIARLKQDTDGLVALDDAYVPPCLHISCSPVLTGMVRSLLEVLHAKSASLSESRSQRTKGVLEFSSIDLGNFYLLHTVNTFIPILDHYRRVRQSHPESMFTTLAQLAGALMTFSPTKQAKDLPGYDHNDLSTAFLELEKAIHGLLKAVVPTACVQVPLQKHTDSNFTADITDDQLLFGSQLFLAARADLPEHQLIRDLPQQTKISSVDTISSLLGHALPGVSLTHSPAPPSPLRVKLGFQYFRLEPREDSESLRHWEEIRKSRSLAIRLPGQRFPGLQLELWSIKEE